MTKKTPSPPPSNVKTSRIGSVGAGFICDLELDPNEWEESLFGTSSQVFRLPQEELISNGIQYKAVDIFMAPRHQNYPPYYRLEVTNILPLDSKGCYPIRFQAAYIPEEPLKASIYVLACPSSP